VKTSNNKDLADKICFKCGEKGHLRSMCGAKGGPKPTKPMTNRQATSANTSGARIFHCSAGSDNTIDAAQFSPENTPDGQVRDNLLTGYECDDPPLRSTYVKVCHITASGEPRPDTSAVRRRVVRNSSRPSRVAWRQYLARHLGPGLASNDPDLWSKLCLKIVYKGNGIRFGTFGRMICWTRRDWSIQLL
jgi:hypothetical protein